MERRGRHEGTCRQRPDGRWEARISLGVDSAGRSIRRSVYGATKDAVVAKAANVRGAPVERDRPERMTVAQMVDIWLKFIESAGLKKNTRAVYKTQARQHIARILGSIDLGKLGRHNIDTLLDSLEGRTKTSVFDVAKIFFGFGVARGYMRVHPMTGLKKPKLARRAKVRIWTEEETAKVLAEAKASPWYAAYGLALGGGLRRGEIFALTWRDVDLKQRTVRVEKSLEETAGEFSIEDAKTATSARTVDLPSFAIDALNARREAFADAKLDDLIFADRDGGYIRRSNFDRRIHHPLVKRAAVSERTVHEMRHTHASLLLAKGENIKLVSVRLGHADVKITLATYAHLMPDAQATAARKLDDLVIGGSARRKPRRLRA